MNPINRLAEAEARLARVETELLAELANARLALAYARADAERAAGSDREVYAPREAARWLGISESTLYRLTREGVICSRKIAGARRYTRADLDSYLEAAQVKAS